MKGIEDAPEMPRDERRISRATLLQGAAGGAVAVAGLERASIPSSPRRKGERTLLLVVFLGDSITQGAPFSRSRPVPSEVRPFGYPEQVGGLAGSSIGIVNEGIGGQTTAQIRSRFNASVLSYRPDYVNLLGGANDVRVGATPASALSNLEAMAKDALANRIVPIFNTMTPVVTPAAASTAFIGVLNAGVRSLASDMSLPLVDLHQALLDPTVPNAMRSLYAANDVHPSQLGDRAMAEAWMSTMSGHLSDWRFDRRGGVEYIDDPYNTYSDGTTARSWLAGVQRNVRPSLTTSPTTVGRWQQFTAVGGEAFASLPVPRLQLNDEALECRFAFDTDADLAGNAIDMRVAFYDGSRYLYSYYGLYQSTVAVSNLAMNFVFTTPSAYTHAAIEFAVSGGGPVAIRIARLSLKQA